MHVHGYGHVHMHGHVYLYVYVYMHGHGYVYVHGHGYVYVYIHVYVYVYVYVCTLNIIRKVLYLTYPYFKYNKLYHKLYKRTYVHNFWGIIVHGGYGEWSNSPCSRTCGGGEMTRTRSCNSPAPQYGGENCVGISEEVTPCNPDHCPSKYILYFTLIYSLCHNILYKCNLAGRPT